MTFLVLAGWFCYKLSKSRIDNFIWCVSLYVFSFSYYLYDKKIKAKIKEIGKVYEIIATSCILLGIVSLFCMG